MLEFTNFPPRAEKRPRTRRMAVKTPKTLKVRCVSIASHRGQHPTGLTESQIRNAELEIAKGAKWVSVVICSNIYNPLLPPPILEVSSNKKVFAIAEGLGMKMLGLTSHLPLWAH